MLSYSSGIKACVSIAALPLLFVSNLLLGDMGVGQCG
uniref:Uncharacterized protein n=1 Tax=Anguilla anguilla TaxID=7936 RepID=A0A0E9R2S4_ANGAN